MVGGGSVRVMVGGGSVRVMVGGRTCDGDGGRWDV